MRGASDDLPWVSRGEPIGVGVCLSGGGLRAASFAYGAVQALQAKRGLLYGATCADYLSVVSGGSYLAAALTLNSIPPLADGSTPPLGRESCEAKWVSSHGSYFRSLPIIAKVVGFLFVNLVAFASLYYFFALALVVAAEGQQEFVGIQPPVQEGAGLYVVAGLTLLFGGFWWLRGLYMVGRRRPRIVCGLLVLFFGTPSIVAGMDRVAGGWTGSIVAMVAFGLFVLAGVVFGLGMRLGDRPLWRPVGWVGARIPAVAGLALLGLATSELSGAFDLADGLDLGEGVLVGSWVLAAPMSWLAGRVSLHRLYRERLATCFSIRRADGRVSSIGDTAATISQMRPPERGTSSSYPRLLVCATANVVWDPARLKPEGGRWSPPGKQRYASFVYSHDRCGVPNARGASFGTTDLERLTTHAGVGHREPLVSLMTAVASTGAAAAPAMGRRTSSFLRTTCALTNVRLGRWLPNPMNDTIRSDVEAADADARMRKRRVLGSGFNEFVPELFGMHRTDAPTVYISDGGHYDNLGLIALLHARCRQIWCVDAQADRKGEAGQLRNTLKLALMEVGVEADTAPLQELQNASSHTVLVLRYPEGQTATLVVIKLGVKTSTLAAVAEKLAEKRFPHHGTFLPPSVMWYRTARFRAYGDVGFENASAAASDARVQAAD